MIDLIEFTCGRCQAINRLKFERILQLQQNPKCGGCKEPLLKMMNEPLRGLDPAAYTHHLDKEALDALQKIPGVKTFLKWLIKNSAETAARLQHHASFIRIGENQVPSLYKRSRDAAERLDIKEPPELFVFQGSAPNAFTFGVEKYQVAISTGCLELLSEEEQLAVLGHELGHVHADHVLYKTAAKVFSGVASTVANMTLGVGGLLVYPLQAALFRWDRASELTGDRAAMLVVRKPEVVLSTLMKVSGGTPAIMKELSIKAFIEQAEEFEKMRDETGVTRILVALDQVFRSHPFPVYRAKEALDFVSSGAFLEILDGDYPQRSLVQTTPCPRCKKPLVPGTLVCPHCAHGGDEDLEESFDSLGEKLDKGFDDARHWFKKTFGGEDDKGGDDKGGKEGKA